MKVNKDLADATMMVSFIVLVLVGTTTYDSEMTKNIIMGALAVLCVVMGVLRYLGSKNETHKPENE